MPQITFSPLEEAVLSMIGSRWWTLEELQNILFPQYCPQSVKSAVAFLKRQHLILTLERRFGTPMYEQTALGLQVLCQARQQRISHYRELAREGVHVG